MGKIIDALKELIKEFIQPNNEGGSFEELALSSGLNEKDIQLLKDTMNGNEKDLAEEKPVSKIKIKEENKDEDFPEKNIANSKKLPNNSKKIKGDNEIEK